MENIEIARIFEEVGDLLEIQNQNPFRVRAYRNAARTVETLGRSATALAQEDPDALCKLPGVGKDLAGKITAIVETGELPLLTELKSQLPEGLVQMMHIGGLGPKRAKLLYDRLGIKALDELEAAVADGRLRSIRGFGEVLEQRLRQGIAEHKAQTQRFRLSDAEAYLRPLLAHLRAARGLKQLEVAGSFRRRRETVGDVDILAAATQPRALAERFVSYPQVARTLAHGATRCSVVLRSGLQVDLRTVPQVSWGAALHYFTGSRPHNIAVRTLGVKRKLKINEYGVFRGNRRVSGRTEEEVFDRVGLPWIAPELRENRGEIEAARAGRLPTLIELKDMRGDLQMHSTWTDGKHTIQQMAEACRARGYTYIALTDHTQAVRVAGGLTRAGFRKQFKEIEKIQKRMDSLTILKGAEVDILDDGRLDLDEATLRELDVVVVSVHSKFNMSRSAMTKRIVKALQHPRAQILGHPTGRLLGHREGYPVDVPAIVRVAREEGVLLEVNAQAERLDLNDVHIQMAREAGVRLVISTDSHRVEELECMRYGVEQARRGWCEAKDVANTYPLPAFRKALKPARSSRA